MKKSPGAIFRVSPEGVKRGDALNKGARARHRDQLKPDTLIRARNERWRLQQKLHASNRALKAPELVQIKHVLF
jgi:hypothetical protein